MGREKTAIIIIVVLVVCYVLYANMGYIIGTITEPFVKGAQIEEDKCRSHCNGLDALNFNLDGTDCKCWFGVPECRGYCHYIGAYAFDEKDGSCRCWFK